MTAPRIVLDTNILIASIGRKSPFRWVFDSIINGRVLLCVSNDILFEYEEVIARKAGNHVAENVVNFLTVSPFTNKIDIYFNFGLIGEDPSDNKFADCAVSANADFLVSNDRHFHPLKKIEFPKINLFTIQEFDAFMNGASNER